MTPNLTVRRRGGAQEAIQIALRDQMVVKHLPLVKIIALHMHQRLPAHVELEDMVQAGSLGLFHAACGYDTAKRVVFSNYAKHRIKGAILDSLRELDWASRDMRRRHKEVEAAGSNLAAALGRPATEAEVAEELGMDLSRFRTRMIDLRNAGLLSASTRGRKDEELPAPDFPDKLEGQPDWIYEHRELCSALEEAARQLPKRDQRIFRLYYYDEMTMKEIGTVLGINESRVSQIHKVALAKMAKLFETIGIKTSLAFLPSVN